MKYEIFVECGLCLLIADMAKRAHEEDSNSKYVFDFFSVKWQVPYSLHFLRTPLHLLALYHAGDDVERACLVCVQLTPTIICPCRVIGQ